MKYIAAYMLSALTGNVVKPIDIEKIFNGVGVQYERDTVIEVCNKFDGRSIESLINAGMCELAFLPARTVSATPACTPTKTANVESVDEEDDSVSDDENDMGFGLFD